MERYGAWGRERTANSHQLQGCQITSLFLQTGYLCVAWPGLELTLFLPLHPDCYDPECVLLSSSRGDFRCSVTQDSDCGWPQLTMYLKIASSADFENFKHKSTWSDVKQKFINIKMYYFNSINNNNFLIA